MRVLANVESNAYWTDTMLHELGHGSYDAGIDGSLPWLLRTTHLIPNEGIAMLFGRLAKDPDVAQASRRGSTRASSSRSPSGSPPRRRRHCSSSRAGCSS